MAVQPASYPVRFDIDEPPSLSRWLWLFKWLLLLPHLIVLSIVGFVASIVTFILWVVIVITGKRPRGLFDFLLGYNRWSVRVGAYYMHMTDEYPPFSMDELSTYPARLSVDYQESANRLTTFFRWILVIPQWIITGILGMVLWFVMFIHVIVVIFTGKPQSELFNFMVGVSRWSTRVNVYYSLMVDKYPPFSME